MSTQVGRLYHDTESVVAAVSGYGIPGSMTELPVRPLPRGEWTKLTAEVRRHRLDTLLAAAVSHTAMPVDEDQEHDVRRLNATARSTVALLDAALADVVETLEEHGVETRVLDGSAVAHLDYHHGSELRTFSTVEVLVRRETFGPASRMLADLGFHRSSCLSPDPDSARFTTPGGQPFTVRCALLGESIGLRVDERDLWERHESFTVANREVRALARSERLLDACCRIVAVDTPDRWGQRRDIAESALHSELDALQVLSLAAEWRAEQVLADAISSTWLDLRLADVVALSSWAQAQRRVRAAGEALVRSLPATRSGRGLLARLTQRVPGGV